MAAAQFYSISVSNSQDGTPGNVSAVINSPANLENVELRTATGQIFPYTRGVDPETAEQDPKDVLARSFFYVSHISS